MSSSLARCFVGACVAAMALVLLAATPSGAQPLDPRFYDKACPAALPAVKRIVEETVAVEPRMGASLLRLHFHDCFVNVSINLVLYGPLLRVHDMIY
jgi:peroxidase